jgi:pimeloyl-[acyl-carrier protein] methyl ester esterase
MPSFASAAGPRLHYEDVGAGAPVVVLHGWSLSSRFILDAVIACARGRRVVALDLRGHGGSSPARFALDDLASDVAAVFDRLQLERAVLLGWSLGAEIALASLPALGRRVERLALVSATPRFTACDGWPHGLPARTLEAQARHVDRDPARAAARFFEGMFVPGEVDEVARARAAALRDEIPVPDRPALRDGLSVLATADLRGALASVAVPTLLVHGESDPVCLPGAAFTMADAIPDAGLVTIPEAGHAPFLTRPAEFRAAVAPFLAPPP